MNDPYLQNLSLVEWSIYTEATDPIDEFDFEKSGSVRPNAKERSWY